MGKSEDFQLLVVVGSLDDWMTTMTRNAVVKVAKAAGKAKNGHFTWMHVFCSKTVPKAGLFRTSRAASEAF